ncbi:classical arabinogalactan protein 9-like [Trichogramma pretiosum]|uniref:classical arabinogalactan protein 9-like n=1 Tax=Trichogramma pretiosum TaxID=7493 RepID=UPI0006C9E09F|nr:classical arabinogalactan protein 9-like [Trichogramma pretiosum]
MSQHPSRGGPPNYGSGPSGWPPTSRASAPSPFRPASPFSPATQARGVPLAFHHQQQHMHHPMSPISFGMPMSPGMSPVFGGPPASPGFIQCPRPRWPAPAAPPANAAARPFIPISPMHQPQPATIPSAAVCQSPLQPCGPPEFLIAAYQPGEYEYVGVPLDHQHRSLHRSEYDDEVDEVGPSTAEIIASQSQDYVDEKLAEYQATIHQLQGESST